MKTNTNIGSLQTLIRWDIKSKVFVFGLLVIYALLVLNKIHGSSVAMWNQILPAPNLGKKAGVLFGEPRTIRSDEWLGVIMFILSQSEHDYAPTNENIGYGNSPMMMNIPTKTWLTFLKPSYWGFMLFDVERGFSFYWNFRLIMPMVGMFLFLMILTGSNFWLAVLGSFWLEFTTSVQWWSLYPAEMYAYILIGLVAFIYIIRSDNKIVISIYGLVLLINLFSFAVSFYPAWQVPLVYFALSVLAGIFSMFFDIDSFKKLLIWRISTFVLIAIIFSIAAYYLFTLIRPTSEVMMNTAYPGKRFITGGGYQVHHFFADYFSLFITDGKLPATWSNVCEISSVLHLFLMPLLLYASYIIVNRKIQSMFLLGLSIVIIFFLAFLFIGFPDFLAKASLLYFSPGNRLNVMFGIVSITFCIVFLSQRRLVDDIPKIWTYIAFALSTLVLVLVLLGTKNETKTFFNSGQYAIVFVLISLANASFLLNQKWGEKIFAIVVIVFLLNNIGVNPINKGLPVFYKHPLREVVKQIKSVDPDAKWAVFGNFIIPNFFKAQGLDVVNGLTNVPDLEKMKILDPSQTSVNIYNRYGYLMFNPFINGQDSVAFILHQPDLFSANLDPCSPKLSSMGVKYIVFAYQPQPVETRCMSLVHASTVLIYKIND